MKGETTRKKRSTELFNVEEMEERRGDKCRKWERNAVELRGGDRQRYVSYKAYR
jgi:hypothetical protein